jgi:hypothetical protein
MNTTGLVFIFITYSILKAMIFADATNTNLADDIPTFPEFTYNQTEVDELFDFVTVSGVDAIAEAVQNIAIAIVGGFKIIVAVLLYLFDLLLFIGQMIGFLVVNAFTGLGDEAPWYINLILVAPTTVMIGMIIYKSIRSGDDTQ